MRQVSGGGGGAQLRPRVFHPEICAWAGGIVEEAVARLGTGPAALAEVKLKNRTKLRGHVAGATDEHFTVVDSEGRATRVAYAEVESVKAVKPRSARKRFDEKGLIGLSLIGGIFPLAFAVASGTK